MNRLSKILNCLLIAFIIGHFLIDSTSSSAQITFQKTFSGGIYNHAFFVEQTSDGGYIITGSSKGDSYNSVLVLLKLDAAGDTMWTRIIGCSNELYGWRVRQTSDNGFIILASTDDSNKDFEGFALIRINATGDTLWTKTYVNNYGTGIGDILVLDDGSLIIIGDTHDSNTGLYYFFMMKCDETGNILWNKELVNKDLPVNLSGSCIGKTTDGNFIIAGTFNRSQFLNGLALFKINSSGDTLWTKLFLVADPYPTDIHLAHDGGYILSTTPPSGGKDGLIKTDSYGNVEWVKKYWNMPYLDTHASSSVSPTDDDGFILSGSDGNFSGDFIYLVKTNSTGDVVWSKEYGADDNVSESLSWMTQTSDHGYILCGGVSPEYFSSEIYTVKTDSLGTSGCNENPVTFVVIPDTFQYYSVPIQDTSLAFETPTVSYAIGKGMMTNTNCFESGFPEITDELAAITIYPNPASDRIAVSLSKLMTDQTKLIFYDEMGIKKKEFLLRNSTVEIGIEDLMTGIHFYEVVNKNQVWYTGKLIVQR